MLAEVLVMDSVETRRLWLENMVCLCRFYRQPSHSPGKWYRIARKSITGDERFRLQGFRGDASRGHCPFIEQLLAALATCSGTKSTKSEMYRNVGNAIEMEKRGIRYQVNIIQLDMFTLFMSNNNFSAEPDAS